jgi:hypothetical protein
MSEKKEIEKPRKELIELPEKEMSRGERAMSYTNAIVFVLVLVSGGVFSLMVPRKEISQIENRRLTSLPQFSIESLFAGHYTDSLDLYYSDNFPLRDTLVHFASTLQDNYGFRYNDVKIYNVAKTNTPAQSAKSVSSLITDSTKLTPDSSLVDTSLGDGHNLSSVVIFHEKAYQIFGGTKHSAKIYGNMINKYQRTLGDSVNVFVMVPPTSTDFYLPSKYKGKGNPEQRFANNVFANLLPQVKRVDAWSEINQHLDEYLYFYTDHHWNGRGAYYAYRAFCQSAGFVPYELNQFTRKMNKGFLGSLYAMTQDSRLKDSKDSVEMFIPPVTTQSYYFNDNLKKPFKTWLFAVKSYSYSAFLGGDHPLMRVDVPANQTGRKILVIKDSYGNAFAPYLTLHYDQVYIVDYRYFRHNIADLVRENKITDIIFAHNSFAANNPYTTYKDNQLLTSKFLPQPAVKKDSTTTVAPPAEQKGIVQ